MPWHHNSDERTLTGHCSGHVDHLNSGTCSCGGLPSHRHMYLTFNSFFTGCNVSWCGIIQPYPQPLITPQWSQARCSCPYLGKAWKLECKLILMSRVFSVILEMLNTFPTLHFGAKEAHIIALLLHFWHVHPYSKWNSTETFFPLSVVYDWAIHVCDASKPFNE